MIVKDFEMNTNKASNAKQFLIHILKVLNFENNKQLNFFLDIKRIIIFNSLLFFMKQLL